MDGIGFLTRSIDPVSSLVSHLNNCNSVKSTLDKITYVCVRELWLERSVKVCLKEKVERVTHHYHCCLHLH